MHVELKGNIHLLFKIKFLHGDFYKRKVEHLMCSESQAISSPRATDPTSQCTQNLNKYGQRNKKLQPHKRIIQASQPYQVCLCSSTPPTTSWLCESQHCCSFEGSSESSMPIGLQSHGMSEFDSIKSFF